MIRTERLLLRQWRDGDLEPFAAMNADPIVREYFGGAQDRLASDATAARIREHIERHGFGFWAAEIADQTAFIGFVGLKHVPDELPFAPGVEIGWRLARPFWGCGYATEAARAALTYGFGKLALREIVSFAVTANHRSRAVMERIGMAYAGRFDYPEMSADDPLCEHVLYRLAAPH